MKLFCYHFGTYGFWFRILGYGLSFRSPKMPILFSERNGYKKSVKLPYGWRICYLPKDDFK